MRVQKWMSWCLVSVLLGGCCSPVRENVDHAVDLLAAHPVDVGPPGDVDTTPPQPQGASAPSTPVVDPKVTRASAVEPALPAPKLMLERLPVPSDVPGGSTKPIQLPADPKERAAALDRLFPPLPPLGTDYTPGLSPQGTPLTLAELQHMALTSSPLIRQAAADVEAAQGAVRQAGAYPNPNIGYEGDTIGTGPNGIGPGYQGGFVEQLIKTGGKLQLAKAAAIMDLRNAEVALHRAESDLIGQVRSGYFSVLVAQEGVKVALSLARFTDEVYKIELEQVRGAQAAPYEPLQVRVLVFQARGALVQARNRYVSAWKQLAATLGVPALPPTQLVGRADMPIPSYAYDHVLAHVLRANTDVLTAANGIQRARYNLRAQQVAPIPDVDLHLVVQKDYTSGQGDIAYSVQTGIQLPVWDQNKGGIRQAQGQLLRAVEEEHRVRDDLTTRLADAFERYENNRVLLGYYRDRILPDQVRAFRGVYERHNQDPDHVSFGDVITAQQTMATSITTYLTTLQSMWQAVVDVSTLLQTKDLFQVSPEMPETICQQPIPDLEQLAPLPCSHPCSTAPETWLRGADGHWPPADPNAVLTTPENEPGRAK